MFWHKAVKQGTPAYWTFHSLSVNVLPAQRTGICSLGRKPGLAFGAVTSLSNMIKGTLFTKTEAGNTVALLHCTAHSTTLGMIHQKALLHTQALQKYMELVIRSLPVNSHSFVSSEKYHT